MLIKASQECFLKRVDSSKFISYRQQKPISNYINKLEVAEQNLLQLQTKQKYMAKLLMEARGDVCTLQRQCKNPVTIYEVFQACHEMFPDVTIVLSKIIVQLHNCAPQVEQSQYDDFR